MATELAGVDARPRRVALDRAGEYVPAAAVAAGIGAIAAAQGGYFPTAWGWSALACLWGAALALVLGSPSRISRAEVVFLALAGALVGWIALSIAWSASVSGSVAEVERALVYAGGFLAFVLVARKESVERLLAALLVGLAPVCAYSLVTRLFPASFSSDSDFFGYRLMGPVGYWNALGILAALAALLAAGFAIHARSTVGRCLAAATLPVLLPTLLYTYSRGAWVALAAGLVVAVALAAQRLRLVTGLLVLAPAPALAVWLASRPDALTHRGTTIHAAAHAGHRVAVEIMVLIALSAAAAFALTVAERRIHVGPEGRRAWAIVLVAAFAAVLVAGVAALGHPIRKVENAYHGFVNDQGGDETNLNQRLLSFSSTGRRDNWRVAVKEFGQHPVAGSGAGTYESYWYRYRSIHNDVKDAHSLYVETLAELGVVGLALLVALLAVPFAGVRARGRPLIPVALGAFAAFLVHAGYDWDWEMPAVTLTGVFCGLAALAAARHDELELGPRARGALIGVTVCLAGFAFVGLVGSMASASSSNAVAHADWHRAAKQARRATAWNPWAAHPWYLLSLADLGLEHHAAAVADLKRAIDLEPQNYVLWQQLADITHGRERQAALRRLHLLNQLAFPTAR